MRKLLAIFALLIALDSQSAIITVTYATSYENGGPYNWTPQAQAAFERAVEVVEESIYSPFVGDCAFKI